MRYFVSHDCQVIYSQVLDVNRDFAYRLSRIRVEVNAAEAFTLPLLIQLLKLPRKVVQFLRLKCSTDTELYGKPGYLGYWHDDPGLIIGEHDGNEACVGFDTFQHISCQDLAGFLADRDEINI